MPDPVQRSLLLVTEEQLHYHFLHSSFSNFEQLCACFILILIFQKKNLLTDKKNLLGKG
jgi:hypothetical protein